jgi:hypothetical protein
MYRSTLLGVTLLVQKGDYAEAPKHRSGSSAENRLEMRFSTSVLESLRLKPPNVRGWPL